MKKKSWLGMALSGLAAGAVAGLFGAGGGMVLVPLLTLLTPLEESEVFPSSITIILPICLVTLAVSAAGEAVLTSTGVTVYDTQFHALWHNDEAIGARRILLTDDGTVFVLYNSNARIFTARSAQSREVTADAAAADS